jgi:hypothetical protein
VHNLRSALDQLVWQLVLLNDETPKRDNQFPIIRVEKEYWEPGETRSESVRERMLRGVREDHRAPIDGVQPYLAGNNAPDTALSHLNTLANTDKHRVIHAAFFLTAEPSPEQFTATTAGPEDALIDVSGTWGRLDDGAEILRLKPVTASGAPVKVEGAIPAYIAFGERGMPAKIFNFLADWIERYVRSFAPVFEGEPHPGPPQRRVVRHKP